MHPRSLCSKIFPASPSRTTARFKLRRGFIETLATQRNILDKAMIKIAEEVIPAMQSVDIKD